MVDGTTLRPSPRGVGRERGHGGGALRRVKRAAGREGRRTKMKNNEQWSTSRSSPNFRPVCTVRHNSTAFRMPFVSSFLSVHLSERTGLSRPLTCSPSPYHFGGAAPRIYLHIAPGSVFFLPPLPPAISLPSGAPCFRREGKERRRNQRRPTFAAT